MLAPRPTAYRSSQRAVQQNYKCAVVESVSGQFGQQNPKQGEDDGADDGDDEVEDEDVADVRRPMMHAVVRRRYRRHRVEDDDAGGDEQQSVGDPGQQRHELVHEMLRFQRDRRLGVSHV